MQSISHHFRWPASVLAAIICLAAGRAVRSAPPDFAQAPADAVWVVHADFDALHKSTVYRNFMATVLPRCKLLADHAAKINEQLGMDLSKDLHGMTVFGPKLSQHKATLVMRADWDLQTFRRKLALAKDHAVSTSGGYEIHRFTRENHGQVRTLAGACWQPGTFVFAQTPDEVRSGLDVLDGHRPHIAGRGSPLAAEVPPGTVFLARMIEVGDSLPVESPLLKQTEQIELACGENAGEFFFRGKLVAKDAAAAQQVKKVLDGFLAMARMQASTDADSLKLLDRLELRVEARTVLLDFHVAAADLAVQLEKMVEEYDRRNAK